MSKGLNPRVLRARFRAGALLPALTLALVCAGCAGWNATGGRRAAWTLPFWKGADKPADPAGYDLYADAASQTRPPDAPAGESLAQGRSPTRPRERAEAPGRTLARSDRNPTPEGRAEGRRAGTQDSSIRVTLGRPESLPTLSDPAAGTGTGPMIAAAPSTSWKQGEAAPPTQRAAPGRSDDPTRQKPQQGRRGETPARTAIAAARSSNPEEKLQKLLVEARTRLDAVATYQVDISRVERVGGQLQAEEDVVLNVRRNPKAVLLQWVKGPSKGREVIYSAALNDRMIYVNMGNPSLPLPRMSIPVDSPLVMRNSRHPISEAGFDTIVDNLVKHAAPGTRPARAEGSLTYKGVEQPKGLDHPCHKIVRVTPHGETWEVFLDTRTLMPALVTAIQTSNGELIERYVYRNFKPNPGELASAETFDPDKRWGEPNSFLSRLAKAAAASGGQAKPEATTTR